MITGAVFSFTATVAYGLIFNVPKKALASGGIIGMGGWLLVQWLSAEWLSSMVSILIASIFVASVSQLLARPLKMPSTNLSIAGIIPLVPGAMAYRTMRSFVDGNYIEAIELATETLLMAGAIAAGLMISLSIFSMTKGMSWRNGVRHS
ncbi:threonine/serine exporter family protein [Bacillus horti]|uniref:Uncharacterized membrane protein YjjB (DUF3815 family) n=1 Tax=Caldalkalibacillus horti TaxID=77523 RepID=A0ABT9W2Y0_9BACI|nr:threonine/serine exporter family protein [Bacillus horti]MDQ0167598.1 uncharacterized membrane protein YjjB (DUF3815 family) [Bacillus horti]